jgi:glycosyltransferase involved in cell wall biosynthesis
VQVQLSRADAYPLIVLEGLACSVLPIVIDLPGVRSMVEEYDGFVVAQEGAAEQTASIIRQLDLDEVRQRGRAAAVRVLADHDWAERAKAVNNALRLCMAGAP